MLKLTMVPFLLECWVPSQGLADTTDWGWNGLQLMEEQSQQQQAYHQGRLLISQGCCLPLMLVFQCKKSSMEVVFHWLLQYKADIIPDKYRLAKNDKRCVLCGVNMAMTEVLGEHKEWAHIIIITRGSSDTLSIQDEIALKEYVEYYQVGIILFLFLMLIRILCFR